MNHTHYALINEDNDIVAVVRKDNFSERVLVALRDEYDSAVDDIRLDESDYYNYSVTANVDGHLFKGFLRPTWEY